MSLSRNATGREFQRDGPATEKLLSPRRVRVLFVDGLRAVVRFSKSRVRNSKFQGPGVIVPLFLEIP